MRGGTRRLGRVMKGERAGRARYMYDFLCFLFWDEAALSFCFLLFTFI